MPTQKLEPKVEVKSVKHTFTTDERIELGNNLARSFGRLRGIEAELDQVKASYKAKTAEAEATIDSLSTAIANGFDMRNERCVVLFRPQDRQKDYFIESAFLVSDFHTRGVEKGKPAVVLTEDMTRDDFQADLLQAESKFEAREEIELFKPTEADRGLLIVGRFGGKWFSALRVNIGKLALNERLDSEQKAYKNRPDAVSSAVKRVSDWVKANLKEHAAGFKKGFEEIIQAHAERME